MSFSSIQKFCVNGEGRDGLKATLALAIELCGMSVESFYAHPEHGFFFGWLDETDEGWQQFPNSLSLDDAIQTAWRYLRSPKVKKTYNRLFRAASLDSNFDGIIKNGWEVFYPSYLADYGNDDIDMFYAVIAVKPSLIYLGK